VWTFYLGTHEVPWLAGDVGPLFVSHRRLASRVKLPRAAVRWALDSGGFTEIAMHGRWLTTPAEYVDAPRRYATEIGLLDWAAPMDWMCEPAMRVRTGLTVEDPQRRTVANFLELRELGPELPPAWDYRCSECRPGRPAQLSADRDWPIPLTEAARPARGIAPVRESRRRRPDRLLASRSLPPPAPRHHGQSS
jgi:hypothetical protein